MKRLESFARLSIIVFILAFFLNACSVGGGGPGELAYPLTVSSNSRYLADRQGNPFLITGDAPQALMVNASVIEVDFLLTNRAKHGFNSVWINPITAEYGGGRADLSTFDGLKPVATAGDFETPNEAYFARCDEIIRMAADDGILIILNPAETGSMLSEMRNDGVDKCRTYGRYLGNLWIDRRLSLLQQRLSELHNSQRPRRRRRRLGSCPRSAINRRRVPFP